MEGTEVAKVFRCPTDGRFLRSGMEYTLLLRDSAATVRYAECPACRHLFAFTTGRRPRAVAAFAMDAGGVSARGAQLGSKEELAIAERGVRTIAAAAATHHGPTSAKRGRRRRPK